MEKETTIKIFYNEEDIDKIETIQRNLNSGGYRQISNIALHKGYTPYRWIIEFKKESHIYM